MQRRRHRGLVTTGGTGQGPEPRHPVASDSEDDETWRCPAAGSTASPQVVPESDPEEPDASPDIRVLRKRRPTPNLGLRTDSTQSPLDPDVARPKKLRLCPKTPPAPDVGGKTAVSGVRPPNRSPDPKGLADPGVGQLGGIESDTDDEADPKSALFHPKRHPAAPEVSGDPNVEERDPNPGAGGAQNGRRWMLAVDSDTDVEEADVPPPVRHPKIRQKAQKVPKTPGGEMKPPNPGSKNGIQALVVDSDTDVEDGGANPAVGLAKSPQTAKNIPKIKTESPHPAVGGPQKEQEPLAAGSDTDVEEDRANPDVVRLPTPQMTPNAPKTPNLEVETPSPGAGGGQQEKWTLVVDSDTDVEEEPSSAGGGGPKSHEITQNAPRNLEVGMETPNPRPGEPQRGREMLTVDSDTDVEEDGLNPDVRCPKTHRMAPKPHDDPDVAIKTPNPHLEGPQNRGQDLELDSDTDVEGEDPSPDIPGRRNHKTPQNAQKDPTVVMETPNPDVGRDLNVDRDTGVKDSGVVPDFGAVRGGQGAPGDPDVGLATPNPEVSPPVTPQSGSDTDVEEVAPTPYVQSLRSKTRPRNPDVDTAMGSDTGVGLTDPKCQKPAPKRQGSPPESRSDSVEGEVPKQPDLAPKTEAEDLNPEDEVLQRNPQTSATGGDADVAPAGLAPKSPIPAPNLGFGGDAARGSRSAQATPGGDTGAEVAESETEEDPDLFLEPTQNFLPPPVTEDAALGWDPEEATQLFCHPKLEEEEEEKEEEEEEEEEKEKKEEEEKEEEEEKKKEDEEVKEEDEEVKKEEDEEEKQEEEEEKQEDEEVKEEEEEEEEEPPQATPAARVPPAEPVLVTPAQEEEGAGTSAAPGGDVTQGPRRSQRLARGHGGRAPAGGGASAVGGASGGGGASQARGGALPCPAPPRRSPRLRARPPSPAEPPAKKGRGQEEPRPALRPRPKRSGHAPSQIREEEEPPEVAGLHLRPRGGAGSSSPKVLFTGVVASPDMEVALGSLGGAMATSVFDCTHLVTDRVRRTVKFLCAVARGVPIVTPKWLHESARSGRVLAPGSFLVRDSQQERHFGFSLSQALSRARRHPLLQGYEVHVTPSVRPEPEQMRDIVTCSGGTFLPTMPCTYGPRRLVISCGEDSGRWAPALSARLPLASAELLLTGLLRQRLQLQDFLLAPPDTPPGPSGVPQDPPPKSPQPAPASPRRLRAPPAAQGRTRRHPQPRNK